MKLTAFTLLSGSVLALTVGTVPFGITHLSAQTTTEDQGDAALHCTHFPKDCETADESADADTMTDDHVAMTQTAAGPIEPGQGMFGAISEISTIIENSGADWDKVDLDALWEHLKDMDALMTYAKVEKTELDNGLNMIITGEGPARRAVNNMIPAHSEFLKAVRPDWAIDFSNEGDTYTVVVTSDDPLEVAKIQALGFSGFMVQDDHHAAHHLGIGVGTTEH
ncbi:hypothetical protein FHS72_001025 [Loktanella ponticola]|uniref:Uncharacterized protein n=1 Tax=Yoonia ponticola TaxID=1524255 RepID=A0A7W9BIY5_9RHOB|nr:hypothetical protein [Yoonia ponticola]MBB5721413.1 hypothetical protein [Yoonia ponticola]